MSFPSGPCSLKGDCMCPYGQLRPKYRCTACNRQLHHFYRGCSMQAEAGNNDKVLCKDGYGCQKTKKGKYTKSAKARLVAEAAAAAAAAATVDDEKKDDSTAVPLPDMSSKKEAEAADQVAVDLPKEETEVKSPPIIPPKPRRVYLGLKNEDFARKRSAPDEDNPDDPDGNSKEPKKRAVYPGGKKRGIRKGSKLQSNKTQEDWYNACQTYEHLKATTHPKMSHVDFLTSEHSGELFSGTLSERQSFGRYMQRYKQGLLQPLRVKRNKPRKYPDIEAKLIAYLDLRQNNAALFQVEDKVSWKQLRKKCLEWAKEAGHHDFQVSPGWMDDTLKRHNRSTPKKKYLARLTREDGDDDDDDDDHDDIEHDDDDDDDVDEPQAPSLPIPPPRKRAASQQRQKRPSPLVDEPPPMPTMPPQHQMEHPPPPAPQQPPQHMPEQHHHHHQLQMPPQFQMPPQQQMQPPQHQQMHQQQQMQPMQQQHQMPPQLQQQQQHQDFLQQQLFQQQQHLQQQHHQFQQFQQQQPYQQQQPQQQQPQQQSFADFQQQQFQQQQMQQQHLNANQQQQLQFLQNLRHLGSI